MERIESQPEVHAHDSGRTAAVQAAFLLPHLRPGLRVLDVGCGLGTITLGLAQAVAPGEVVGVDIVEDRLHLARSAAEEREVGNVRFEPGDIHRLPFQGGEFDAALAHALLEHLPDPLAAMREVRRVLRPGAVVGVRSPEDSLAVIGPAAPWMEEWRTYFRHVGELDGESPQIGRSLRAIVRSRVQPRYRHGQRGDVRNARRDSSPSRRRRSAARGRSEGFWNVAFGSNGRRLVAGGTQAVHGFVLPIEEVVALVRTRLTRTWTLDECQRFLHQAQCPE